MTTFKIKAGEKYRTNHWWYFKFTMKNTISGTFEYWSGVKYDNGKGNKASNKIVGLSDSLYHMDNSIRIVSRWDLKEHKLELRALIHEKGKRRTKHLCWLNSLECWDENSFYIEDRGLDYLVIINKGRLNEVSKVFKGESDYSFIRYVLLPYVEPVTNVDTVIDIKFD